MNKLQTFIVLSIFSMIFSCSFERSNLLNINNEIFRNQRAASAILGSYGKVLSDNSYELDGMLVNNIKTLVVTKENYGLEGKDHDNAEVSLISNIVSADARITPNKEESLSYVAVVATPKDINQLQEIIIRKIRSDHSFKEKAVNKEFRFISEVVLAKNYQNFLSILNQTDTRLIFHSIDKLVCNTESSKKLKLSLSANTIIGYQFRKLCWREGNLVDTVIDLVYQKQDCPEGTSEIYPG